MIVSCLLSLSKKRRRGVTDNEIFYVTLSDLHIHHKETGITVLTDMAELYSLPEMFAYLLATFTNDHYCVFTFPLWS